LVKKVQGSSGTGKVLLVAHSMGGLAIRCALDSSCNNKSVPETQELVGNVGIVVTFGTPNTGSFLAGSGSPEENAQSLSDRAYLIQTCYEYGSDLGTAADVLNFGNTDYGVEYMTNYCPYLRGMLSGEAANSFTPGTKNLTTLPDLPVSPVSVPVTAVAGTVQLKTTLFYLLDVNLRDMGDLVVDQASAHAQVRPGTSDVALTVDCGGLNISLLDRLVRLSTPNPVDAIKAWADLNVNGGKIEIPTCSHVTEPNDDRFLDDAKQALDKWIDDNTPATPTGLTADPLGTTSVRLSWNDVSSHEDGFKVTVNGTPSHDTLASNAITTDVPGLNADTKYCFTVEAFNSAVRSAPTAQACATTQKEAPLFYNTSYTSTCGGRAPHPFTVNVQNGKGTAPGSPQHYDVQVDAVKHGDLTGDGRPETAVLLGCTPVPSNYSTGDVQVFGPDNKLLAELPHAETLGPPGKPPPQYVPSELSIGTGQLIAGMAFYAPTEDHASGPSEHRTLTWRWNGDKFVLSGGGVGNVSPTADVLALLQELAMQECQSNPSYASECTPGGAKVSKTDPRYGVGIADATGGHGTIFMRPSTSSTAFAAVMNIGGDVPSCSEVQAAGVPADIFKELLGQPCRHI
jgi:hypothetical protein